MDTGAERTYIKNTGKSSFGIGSHVAAVDVKDGKILRIRPLSYDWKYKPEEFRPWKIEARGKTFHVPLKTTVSPLGLGYKKSVYSPNRILYPLKRVDWDPTGAPGSTGPGGRNTQNRGRSGYVRISWDEALDLIVAELRRVIDKYGPYAVFAQGDGHGETKTIHGPHGCQMRLLELLGGYTLQVRNADSWEGWYWGTKHVWGGEPFGLMPHPTNMYPDISRHSDQLLFWGCDPITTTRGFNGGDYVGLFCSFWKEIGIRQIYVCPDLNYGAAVFADKWIPILPNTDAAMQLAIAHYWIEHDLYDKEYVATHTVGFESFSDYVLGKEDGVPKTPQWAAEKTLVPSRIIKALARAWAAQATSCVHGFGGGLIRGPYSHEPARLEAALLAMQGIGRPGQHSFCIINRAVFGSEDHPAYPPSPGSIINNPNLNLRSTYRGYSPFPYAGLPKQFIPKTLVHDAILKGTFTIHGSSLQSSTAEEQFVKYEYPVEGCSPIHMIWSDAPCLMTCWNDSNQIAAAYQHPSIECFIAQHPWLENDCLFADLILPVNTKFEEEDICIDTESVTFEMLYLEHQCIESLGESKSDYEIVCMVAERLGLLEQYTEGKSIQEWIRYGFDTSRVPDTGLIDWETFQEKQYFVVPSDPNWEGYSAGMYDFYRDPEAHPLETPSGKLEFQSLNLTKYFPEDRERPPVPHWVEKSELHDERLSSARASKFPLLCVSNHPRHRVHAQMDDHTWSREIVSCKVKGPDGYLYEPVWLHPSEAAKRGIKDGDICRIFNERGAVLVGARVWERIMPGVAYVDHGARADFIVSGELDRGGAINTISPHSVTSKNCAGMASSGFLVEVAPVDLEALTREYPEAFSRPYSETAGLRFDRVLVEREN
ncbi:MAG: molybdopterin-dependent oxidoreductase [Actinomycetia bacterium]|nr:molybdopterin-dependent oxidoreductase [Actinomycetes bacterium]